LQLFSSVFENPGNVPIFKKKENKKENSAWTLLQTHFGVKQLRTYKFNIILK
jgi:hypothetical protein